MAEQTKTVKKQPERKCVGCSKQAPKKELIRVVREPNGNVCLDFTGKKSGRGAYICRSASCLKKAVKSKRLERNLAVEIPDEIYKALEVELLNNEQ
ncbi:MAG: YlxR family protein [Ruminococcaceae bacterium]|nr:YlxR family protein [Oscillospiraceae bacterium]